MEITTILQFLIGGGIVYYVVHWILKNKVLPWAWNGGVSLLGALNSYFKQFLRKSQTTDRTYRDFKRGHPDGKPIGEQLNLDSRVYDREQAFRNWRRRKAKEENGAIRYRVSKKLYELLYG